MTAIALPLADAQRRLGRPGRPKKVVAEAPGPSSADVSAPALNARLLDVPGAAAYLSISVWSVRDLLASGALARVRIATLRRVLLDRQDLDRLIGTWKERV